MAPKKWYCPDPKLTAVALAAAIFCSHYRQLHEHYKWKPTGKTPFGQSGVQVDPFGFDGRDLGSSIDWSGNGNLHA